MEELTMPGQFDGTQGVFTGENSPGEILRSAEILNRERGHENFGPLSLTHGFTPGPDPLAALPSSHAAWDELARDLPELYASLELRRRLERAEPFDASESALPDRYLQRAATVLGILVHAYHRVSPRHDTPTPDAILVPWHEVCARLGRETPFLSYLDLIVCNWRFRDPAGTGPRTVENLRLLVPTVGTDEEQFFYLTQLEMLHRGSPLVGSSIRACAAVEFDDAPSLAAEMTAMADCVADITRYGLPKIDPLAGRAFHVDPVVWAKTVAPLAVPLVEHGLGPSGTASPMFHLLDSVIGRAGYRSFIGNEASRLRENFPVAWRSFIQSVGCRSLPDYVATGGHPELEAALAGLRKAYSGEGGLLSRHRLKVSGYLNTSYRVGRDVTISGFPAAVRVGNELAASRAERLSGTGTEEKSPLPAIQPAPEPEQRIIFPSELLRHDHRASRQWICFENQVYDVTRFLRRHPGGATPLTNYLGTDVTEIFEHIGHDRDDGVTAILRRMRIGVARRPALLLTDKTRSTPLACTYETWLGWAAELTQRSNALAADLSIRDARTSAATERGELTRYTLQFAVEVHERFVARTRLDIATTITEELRGGIESSALPLYRADHLVSAVTQLYDALESADEMQLKLLEEEWREVTERDLTYLRSVKSIIVHGLHDMETRHANTPDDLPQLLGHRIDAIHEATASYHRADNDA
ncbi:cytochrome b5 domain-containing protein [Streptomyces coelicoflavus]|uniref:cytochrome b5 domain-containing protein n=1 Tax=Streptomyces coelicoflavus TaxID=285562 RepID=UPI00382E96A9